MDTSARPDWIDTEYAFPLSETTVLDRAGDLRLGSGDSECIRCDPAVYRRSADRTPDPAVPPNRPPSPIHHPPHQ